MQGIYKEIREGLYSDTILMFNNIEHQIHIKYLINKSKYLYGIHNGNMIKNNKIEINMEAFNREINQQTFSDILSFMYNYRLSIDDTNKRNILYLMELYILWDYLGISTSDHDETQCKLHIKDLIRNLLINNNYINVGYDSHYTTNYNSDILVTKENIIFECKNFNKNRFYHNKQITMKFNMNKTWYSIETDNIGHLKKDFCVHSSSDNMGEKYNNEYFSKCGTLLFSPDTNTIIVQCICSTHTYISITNINAEQIMINLNIQETKWLLKLFSDDGMMADIIMGYYDVKFKEIQLFDKKHRKNLCYKYSQK